MRLLKTLWDAWCYYAIKAHELECYPFVKPE